MVGRQPCSALVDTGSTICLLRKGLLSGTAGPLPEDWTPTNTELLTVTGERTVMPGKKLLSVVMITYNIYIVIRETGQFSSKGIINDFIGNLNRLTVSRRFTKQAV